MIVWLLCILIWPIMPCETAEEVAASHGARCDLGCFVGADGWVYELNRNDVEWIGKVAKAESGPRFVERETSATLWALAQGFYETSMHRPSSRRITFATYIQHYSAACSVKWSSEGTRYHPRITPRADRNRAMTWDGLPHVWRNAAADFVGGRLSNLWPGWIHVLARGFEDAAAPNLIGPFYATETSEHPGGNAYYQTKDTEHWAPWTLRIVPARREIR